jgi:2-keto-4-pentenoate hydratase/2-oxohepta-3-ene-1,7-dioic acid hydratase in catechol pathway
MSSTRREALAGMIAAGVAAAQTKEAVTRYVRFRAEKTVAYGVLNGETVSVLSGAPWTGAKETGAKHKLPDVKLLMPCTPSKALAVITNYKSHLGNRPVPKVPGIFYKPISCLRDPGEPIVIPPEATDVHYEGEMVVVIGKRVQNAGLDQAREAIFGVTCGNDVSERQWQGGPERDLQWWRAKGADTFGPLGPMIVRGLDYAKLLLQTRLNGKVVQKQYTSDLIFDGPTVISFVSKFVTLLPGDVIYTGTPGSTSKMKDGDVVEVDIEGIGVLRSPVKAGS